MKTYLDRLYKLYQEEVLDLNIGYNFNSNRMSEMFDLIYVIDFLSNECVSDEDKKYIMKF